MTLEVINKADKNDQLDSKTAIYADQNLPEGQYDHKECKTIEGNKEEKADFSIFHMNQHKDDDPSDKQQGRLS